MLKYSNSNQDIMLFRGGQLIFQVRNSNKLNTNFISLRAHLSSLPQQAQSLM